MRTTLQIDDDVLDDAREIAAQDGRSLGAVISELARRSLAPARISERKGLPVFDVPAGSPTFTADQVARALDDE